MPQSINNHLFCLSNFSVISRNLLTEENMEQNDKSIFKLFKNCQMKVFDVVSRHRAKLLRSICKIC